MLGKDQNAALGPQTTVSLLDQQNLYLLRTNKAPRNTTSICCEIVFG